MAGRRFATRPIELEHIWTCAEIGERWQCSAETVESMCRDGRIRGAFKAGRQWRVSTEALIAHEHPHQEEGAA